MNLLPEPIFFASPEEMRLWFDKHAASATELLVGFSRKSLGPVGLSWPEAVDEALCVGWIDGVRQGIDARSYKIRFTPRKAISTWSAVNIKRVAALHAEGRMRPAGLAAFEQRQQARSRIYSYEQQGQAIWPPEMTKKFKAQKKAWAFFEAQPPGYRKKFSWWVMNGKRQETRDKRLDQLIAACLEMRRM